MSGNVGQFLGGVEPDMMGESKNYTNAISVDAPREMTHPSSKLPMWCLRWRMREYLGEFFGTWLLVVFGDGVVATTVFMQVNEPTAAFLMITFGWGIGLAMALYCSLGISGGHLNPAVTIANAVWGGFEWKKVPGYITAQMLGAFTGAACVYGIYSDQFKTMQDGFSIDKTGGIFCTYPKAGNGLAVSALTEFLLTMILLFVINGIFDKNSAPAKGFEAIVVGLLVFSIGTSLGSLTGYAINPARDFGPRVFSAILYGGAPFSRSNYYFWIPLFMPILGGIVGIGLYRFFIIA